MRRRFSKCFERAVVRLFVAFVSLYGLAALSQADGTAIRRRDLVGGGASSIVPTVLQTTNAAVALFVDPTGSDSNACTGTGTNACLTFQGATNKTPKWLRHTATITAACGTYTAGAYIDGFVSVNDLNAPTTGTYIQYDGTLQNVTPATGTATGTATGGTAGVSGTATFGTMDDATQAWTVNDLRGKWVEILTGTGSGQRQVIQSNTATQITIAGDWTAPIAGSTYAINESCTTISGVLQIPAQNSFTAAATGASFVIGSEVRASSSVTLRWLKFTGSGRAIDNRGTAQIRPTENRFESTATTQIVTGPNGNYIFARNSFLVPAATTSIVLNAPNGTLNAYLSFTEDFFRGGGTGTLLNVPVILTNVAVENIANGVRATTGVTLISGSRFDTLTGNCVDTNPNNFTTPAFSMNSITVTGVNLSNCGVAIAVQATGGILTGFLAGTGNTTVYSVANGGVTNSVSTSTITGTTGISVDGTAYTIAALRALVPKVINNLSTFSKIWEP